MSRRRSLGRGLDALLGAGEMLDDVSDNTATVTSIPVDRIERGRYQPRRQFGEENLRELAESIRAQGVVQPIVVRPHGDGYELVAGERRWRASQLAGLHEIPALVRDLDDQASAAVALIENIQREDLNAMEEADALARLVGEFGLTHQEVADVVGRSRAAVSNLLRLQELDGTVKQLLVDSAIDMGHARALLGAPLDQQPALARKVVADGLNVRQTEALVRRLGGAGTAAPKSRRRDPDIEALEQRLAEQLGARVTFAHRNDGSGTLSVRYGSLDELEGILAHLR